MKTILPILTCALLTGCVDPMSAIVVGGATAATYSVTGKSPVDYGLSEYRQKDCDIRNPKKYDGHYCVDHEVPQEPVVYCYTTLGTPDCSTQLDPHNNGEHPIVMATRQPSAALPQKSATTTEASHPISLTPALPKPRSIAPTPAPQAAKDPAQEGS